MGHTVKPGFSPVINVVINGEPHTIPSGLSISGALGELGIAPGRVAVELNRCIVRQPDWPTTVVEAGSELEIVQFVGGG